LENKELFLEKVSYSEKPSNYEFLLKLRKSKNVQLKPCTYIKDNVKLRNYQAIGALHFLCLNRMILGDGVGLGKSLQAIAGYAYALQKDPALKLLIAAPKSALDQWKEEFEKFTKNISVHVLENTYGRVKGQEIYGNVKELRSKGHKVEVLRGYDARQAQYNTVDANVLITAYYPIEQDYTFLIKNRGPNFMVAFDECQAFKSRPTQAYLGANKISQSARKVYGLSATIIKNKLDEAYTIYRIIVPGLFGGVTKFNNEFTVQKLEEIMIAGGKKRKIKKIVGYKNLDKFRNKISPYILLRKTSEVADELPSIISKKLMLEMTPDQDALYKEALNGNIYRRELARKYFEMCDYIKNTVNPTEKDLEDFDKLKERYEISLTEDGIYSSKMAALSYCQIVSNGPGWLDGYEGESSKEQEFKRLFEEELFTEKVIVFTRFKSGITRLEKILDDLNIEHRKITGDVSKDDRTKARLEFTDPNKKITVMFITQAGSAALNLQAANIMLFIDTPWSYGDLYQIIGRAQRIGSIHKNVIVMHMINKKTIDQKVLTILEKKKELITNVMGDIAEGAIEFNGNIKVETDTMFNEGEDSIDALFNAVFSDTSIES